jgi:hypothetical protein
VDLMDTTSESDTSDPGGMPQLFRRPTVPSARSPKVPRRQTTARRSALKPAVAAEPRRKTREPPLLKKHEHKIRRGGVTNPCASLGIARKTRDEDEGEVKTEAAIQRAEEQPTAEAEESPRCRLLRGLGTNPNSTEGEAGSVRTPAM